MQGDQIVGPRKIVSTGYQDRLEVLLRTLLRVESGPIDQWALPSQGRARQQPIFFGPCPQASGSVGSLIQHASLRRDLMHESVILGTRLRNFLGRFHEQIQGKGAWPEQP